MGKTAKIAVLILLIVAVGVIVFLKEKSRDSETVVTANPRQALAKWTSSSLPKLIDLGADKCIPCKMMAPTLVELRKEYAGIFEVVFIDVWKNPSAGKEFGIKIIPTQIFFDASGKELYRHQGFISKEDILARWKEFGINLKGGTTHESKRMRISPRCRTVSSQLLSLNASPGISASTIRKLKNFIRKMRVSSAAPPWTR